MIDVESYARELEAYLCRKNDGHLIRITGPAFEQVQGWAAQGVPIKVAEAGIDRYFERYYRKGPRRRPVRIEFCEADVLEPSIWRRAVGVIQVVSIQPGPDVEDPQPASRPRRSLASRRRRAGAIDGLLGSDHAGPILGSRARAAVSRYRSLRKILARSREARYEVMRCGRIDRKSLAAAAVTALDPAERRRSKGADAEPSLCPAWPTRPICSRAPGAERLCSHFGSESLNGLDVRYLKPAVLRNGPSTSTSICRYFRFVDTLAISRIAANGIG